jgi:hypothetical protein
VHSAAAVLLTLEVSESAIEAVVRAAGVDALKVLTASPMAEGAYVLDTNILERFDVIVGSSDELASLLSAQGRAGEDKVGGLVQAATVLANLCGTTVIGTDFRSAVRRVAAVNPYLDEPVIVRSPAVRLTRLGSAQGVSAAVGNTDAFVAAFAVHALERVASSDCAWRGHGGRLSDVAFLVDILSPALAVEAWVTRSRSGGYSEFPYKDRDFEMWSAEHMAAVDLDGEA